MTSLLVLLTSLALTGAPAAPAVPFQPSLQAAPPPVAALQPALLDLEPASTPSVGTDAVGDPTCDEFVSVEVPISQCNDTYCTGVCESRNASLLFTLPDHYFTQCWCVCCF